jgi:nucleotide-binding universal stress UspA family protein
MKTILVPIDFSAASQPTVASVLTLIDDVHSHIVFLHVASAAPASLLNARANDAAVGKNLRALVAEAHDKGVAASFRVARGEPAGEIVALARELRADLIVMGSHHFDTVTGSTIGATSTEVFKSSPCPLVLVPALKTHAFSAA